MGIFHPNARLHVRRRPTVARDVWAGTQGLFLKINPAQANWAAMQDMSYGTIGRTQWDARLQELGEHASFKGVQISVPWGIYEKGVSGGNFSNLDFLYNMLDDLNAIGKYAILQIFEFREFRNNNVNSLPLDQQYRYLLPPDLNSGSNLHGSVGVDPRIHVACDWAYAYEKNAVNPNTAFGYNLKLYKASLRARLITFCTAIANHQPAAKPYKIKDHPALICISSTESVIGTPSFTGTFGFSAGEGASERAMIDGKTSVITEARALFPDCMFMQDMAFPNNNTSTGGIDYPGEWSPIITINKLSLTTSNSGDFWNIALNRVDSGTLGQGANRYLADFANVAPRFAQLQGDDFDSGTDGYVSHLISAADGSDYTQRYVDLYNRLTIGGGGFLYALNTNYIIMQREHPQNIWTGGTTSGIANVPNGTIVPSFKAWWIAKMATLSVGVRGTGGLNTTRPTHVSTNN